MRHVVQLAGATIATMLLAAPALASEASVTFAQFTQQSVARIAQNANTGSGNSLTIPESPANFVVTAFGPLGVYSSTISMFATSSAPITNLGLQFEQVGWDGTMIFGDGMNFLTVVFANASFSFDGTGGSASLISTDPNNPISYTSSLLTLPEFDLKNFSIAFTGLEPAFSVAANGCGAPFEANVAGSFAGSVVPELAVWAMLVSGMGLTGAAMRRRQTRLVAAMTS